MAALDVRVALMTMLLQLVNNYELVACPRAGGIKFAWCEEVDRLMFVNILHINLLINEFNMMDLARLHYKKIWPFSTETTDPFLTGLFQPIS